MLAVNTIVTPLKLTNAYDAYALRVLSDRLDREDSGPRQKGKRRTTKYKIISPLPTKEEYEALKKKKFTQDAASLAEEAFTEIETLGEEMRGWYENLSEGLQQADRGTRVDDAANTLESVSCAECDVAAYLDVYYLPNLDVSSRSSRCSEAAGQLEAVADAIDTWVEENDSKRTADTDTIEFLKDGKPVSVEVDWDDLETFAQDCRDAAGEIEGVDFPGMYS